MQESPQKTEKQMVELPRVSDDDIGLFDVGSQPIPRSLQRGTPWGTILAIVLIVVIVGGAAFFFLSPRGGSNNSSANYKTQTVIEGNLDLTISATGPVQGGIYNEDFPVTGTVSEIDVTVGQHVNAGQTLARLDTNTLPASANPSGAVLTATHAGTVTAINGSVGSASNSGPANSSSGSSSAGNHFIQIVDSSSLQIIASVDEADIAKVAVNDAIQFTVDAFGSQQFYGTVSAIAPQGVTNSNIVTYPVTINVDMTRLNGANLLSGMTATVTITTDSRNNVLLIPQSAVNFTQTAVSQGLISQNAVGSALSQARQQLLSLQGTASGGGVSKDNPSPAVVLEIANGQWVAKPVVVGLTDGTNYEVLAGLTQGETIVTGTNTSNSSSTPVPQTVGGGG